MTHFYHFCFQWEIKRKGRHVLKLEAWMEGDESIWHFRDSPQGKGHSIRCTALLFTDWNSSFDTSKLRNVGNDFYSDMETSFRLNRRKITTAVFKKTGVLDGGDIYHLFLSYVLSLIFCHFLEFIFLFYFSIL